MPARLGQLEDLRLLLVGQSSLIVRHEHDTVRIDLEADQLAIGTVADAVDEVGLDPERDEGTSESVRQPVTRDLIAVSRSGVSVNRP